MSGDAPAYFNTAARVEVPFVGIEISKIGAFADRRVSFTAVPIHQA